MGGWMDEWQGKLGTLVSGRMGGWMGGWMDGWMDGKAGSIGE